jgi:hypothetical protein
MPSPVHQAHMRLQILFFAAIIVAAQGVFPAARAETVSPPASAEHVHNSDACSSGVNVMVSSSEAAQGSLLQVGVRSSTPLASVSGEWTKHRVSFWRADEIGGEFRALVGVDVAQAAGKYRLEVIANLANGEVSRCGADISVTSGDFVNERLRVAPKFVEPPPADLKRALKEQQQLQHVLAAVSPVRLWSGEFHFPLAGVPRGRNFGTRRIFNGEPRAPHTGLDIPAPTGTPVHAKQRGRVVLAERLFFSGNTVIIDHGLGLYTFYGHLSSIKAKEGDVLKPGELLGLVGATGRVTGPHLHWGFIVNESRVNPLQSATITK